MVNVIPAEVARELMTSKCKDAESSLQGIVEFLHAKMTEHKVTNYRNKFRSTLGNFCFINHWGV